jgi:hypothetical protein
MSHPCLAKFTDISDMSTISGRPCCAPAQVSVSSPPPRIPCLGWVLLLSEGRDPTHTRWRSSWLPTSPYSFQGDI